MQQAQLSGALCIRLADHPASLLIRRRFRAEQVRQATLTIAGFGFFYGFLNGEKVSDDLFLPLNTDYHERPRMCIEGLPFDEALAYRLYCPVYDVTHLLREGGNALCFMVGPGWYEFAQAFWEDHRYGDMKLAYCLSLTYADGHVEHIVSDGSEKAHAGFVTDSYILTGETHDYRGYDEAWMEPCFDDAPWQPVITESLPDTRLYVQDCPADRVERRITPVKLWERDGRALYDAGEIFTGYPLLTLPAGGGEALVRYGELLTPDGALKEENIYDQHTRMIWDAKRTVDTHFTWYCFRYFEVTGPCEVGDCLVIHTEAAVKSSFRCSDDTLNWLYEAFIRTQLANMHCGVPSDCPHIERLGYTGDGQLTCRAVMRFLDVQRFYKKWIHDISDCQDRKTGHVQYAAPFQYAGGGPGGWGGAMVLVPYYYYRHYGDASVLRALYPQMLRYFDYLEAHSEHDLVVSDRPRVWCLGEWCTPDQMYLDDSDGLRIPPAYVNTCFYVKAMQLVLEIQQILDIPPCGLEERIEVKKAALIRDFYDPATGDFCGNDQGGNAFALDIGLGDARTLSRMVENCRRLGRYDTGIFGTDILTRLLFENGCADVALMLLTSHEEVSFYNQRRLGATTIFENWNGVRSQCHPMFGAVSVYLAEYILGIRQQGYGYEQVLIDPRCMEQIPTAAGHITTPRGEIGVEYDEKTLRVRIPAGVRCEVAPMARDVEIVCM